MTGFIETQSYGWVLDIFVGSLLLIVFVLLWLYAAKRGRKQMAFPSRTKAVRHRFAHVLKTILLFMLFLPFVIAGIYFMLVRFDTRIDEAGIHYKMFPSSYHDSTINWEQVANMYIRDYVTNSRNNSQYHIYSLEDRYGLYIILKDSTKIILGTKKPGEINKTITALAGTGKIPAHLYPMK